MPAETAAPPAPAPSSAAPAPAPAAIDPGPSIMSDIDSLFEKPADPQPGAKPDEKENAQPKPDQAPAAAAKPDLKPDAGAKPAEAKPDAKPPGQNLKQLRDELESVKRERDELKKSSTKPADPNAPDAKSLTEQLTKANNELKRLQDEIRFVDYEKSEEYVTKYAVPMEEAFKSAYADVSELRVTENGEQRKATDLDFLRLIKLPLGDATTAAREMFGDAAPEVMAHRRKIIDLNNARQKAIEEYRKNGSEREKAARQELEARHQQWESTFKQISDEAVQKYPQLFGTEQGDDKGNSLLTNGFDFVDRAFKDKNLPPEQVMAMRSQVRLRAAAFVREAHRTATLRSKVAELEKELAAYRTSDPNTKPGGGGDKTQKETDWRDEIDALARKA